MLIGYEHGISFQNPFEDVSKVPLPFLKKKFKMMFFINVVVSGFVSSY